MALQRAAGEGGGAGREAVVDGGVEVEGCHGVVGPLAVVFTGKRSQMYTVVSFSSSAGRSRSYRIPTSGELAGVRQGTLYTTRKDCIRFCILSGSIASPQSWVTWPREIFVASRDPQPDRCSLLNEAKMPWSFQPGFEGTNRVSEGQRRVGIEESPFTAQWTGLW